MACPAIGGPAFLLLTVWALIPVVLVGGLIYFACR
jgi:hypothetical protein